ncbi:MAG: hypothetical protein ACFFAO_09970 [Candidatus Hermodarchaeota archaeon]
MSDKNLPPPPKLPPNNLKIEDNFCLFHKGPLKKKIYKCPNCNTKYCLECAKKAKAEGKKCIKCKQLIFL